MLYCLSCHGDLIDSPSNLQICSRCGECYPSIDGVDVFILPDAISSLSGYVREIEDTKAEFATINAGLMELEKLHDGALIERSARIQSGMSANLKFLEAVYQPIVDFVQSQPREDGDLIPSTLQFCYTGDHMLPYFYQDWCGVPDYETVKELICQTVTERCPDRDKVAVLGTGACGLLYSVADYFQVSYGVDLSLPTLLMAKKLIEGNSLSFQLKKANWHEITVAPPVSSANDIRFIAADVMTLPFKNGSLSVVVTQYLLDIVSNAELFSQEIYRVLKAGGVWINFSKPFINVHKSYELGRYQLTDLPDYFNKLGFSVEHADCHRFTPLNLAAIGAETDSVNDIVHFFSLKKSEQLMPVFKDRSANRFFTKNDAIWFEIPRVVKGREIAFFQKRFLNNQVQADQLWLNALGRLFAVHTDLALLLESLYMLMDGEKNLKELFLILQSQGGNLTEEQFLILIYCLNRQHALIDLC